MWGGSVEREVGLGKAKKVGLVRHRHSQKCCTAKHLTNLITTHSQKVAATAWGYECASNPIRGHARLELILVLSPTVIPTTLEPQPTRMVNAERTRTHRSAAACSPQDQKTPRHGAERWTRGSSMLSSTRSRRRSTPPGRSSRTVSSGPRFPLSRKLFVACPQSSQSSQGGAAWQNKVSVDTTGRPRATRACATAGFGGDASDCVPVFVVLFCVQPRSPGWCSCLPFWCDLCVADGSSRRSATWASAPRTARSMTLAGRTMCPKVG